MTRDRGPGRWARLTLFGALGGLYGAGAMSVLRLTLHRAGVIDKMVPQAVEEWISHRLSTDPPGGKLGRQLTDQALHIVYGVTWGALAAPLMVEETRQRSLWSGGTFGAALWLFGTAVLFPWLRIARPVWKTGARENVANLGAHLVYGTAVQLVAEELARQKNRRRTSDEERRESKVA